MQQTIEGIDNKIYCKPFLRWAGGKRWLIKHFHEFLPKGGFNNYHEPFLGGGSMFFFLQPEGQVYLSDLNTELMNTYIQVRDGVEKVIKHLAKFENTEKCYYHTRDIAKFRSASSQAAKFIYLNQTSFNGIYRVNLNGKYNVPFGYRSKNFFEPDNLRAVSRALSQAILFDGDFKKVLKNVKENDLVFLDPPYTVTHYDNGFIKYNSKLFSEKAQYKLSETIDTIKEKGAYYILTNAAHHEVKEIFKKRGDWIFEKRRASLIGGKNAKRGRYAELIITNTQ